LLATAALVRSVGGGAVGTWVKNRLAGIMAATNCPLL